MRTWLIPAMILCVLAPESRAQAPTDPRLSGSYRLEKDGWIFVRLEGPPERVGFQHGYLLAPEVADLINVLKPFQQVGTRRDWNFYRNAAETILWKGVEPEYQAEIDGLVLGLNARGVKVDRWDVVALNGLEELPYYYVPWLDKQAKRPPSAHAPGNCSAFVATGGHTKDGRIVMGHNNWTNYVLGPRWNIVFDIKPERGHRILMDGLPGVITSDDDFGVNSAGLMVTETTISGFEGFDPNGKAEFSRSRKAMQYASSIDEYIKIMLDGNNGGYANDWLLGDNKTGEIALFELGLKEHSVRRTKDGCFYGANFPVDEKLRVAETTFEPNKKDSSPNARRTRWEELMTQYRGKIDIELAKALETDTYDVIDRARVASERTLCGRAEGSPRGIPEWDWAPYYPGGTVQAKVIDSKLASSMSFWAAMGHHGSPDFIAEEFLVAHPEYSPMRGLLRDLKSRPWGLFSSGMR